MTDYRIAIVHSYFVREREKTCCCFKFQCHGLIFNTFCRIHLQLLSIYTSSSREKKKKKSCSQFLVYNMLQPANNNPFSVRLFVSCFFFFFFIQSSMDNLIRKSDNIIRSLVRQKDSYRLILTPFSLLFCFLKDSIDISDGMCQCDSLVKP